MAKKIIILCLCIITLCFTFSYCNKSCVNCISCNAETLEDTTLNDKFFDKNFTLRQDLNDFYTPNQSGSTIKAVIVTSNYYLTKPNETALYDTYKCSSCFNKTKSGYASFSSAEIVISVSKYNAITITPTLADLILTCDKDGNWSYSVTYYFEEAVNLNLALNKNETYGYFIPNEDFLYSLEILIDPLEISDNYKIDFSYEYKYISSVPKKVFFKTHYHFFKDTISNSDGLLSFQTLSQYKIFTENIKKRYDTSAEDFIDQLEYDYGSNLSSYLLELEQSFVTKTITVAFLKQIVIDEKELPFAYQCVVDISVPVYEGKIYTDMVVSKLLENGYIDENYQNNFLKCLNSNISVGDELTQRLNSVSSTNEYYFSYNNTYDIYLKSSSGNSYNFTIGLSSMHDYYYNFFTQSNKEYSVLEYGLYEVVWNNIQNLYGLNRYRIPDGKTQGNVLTPSDLYGYWGFALIPIGSGVNDLLTNFFDFRKQSTGLTFTFNSPIHLSNSSLNAIQSDFEYTWLSTFLGDILNNTIGNGINTTYYMFYVSELSNDYIYVISENGDLNILNSKSLTDKMFTKFVKYIGNYINKIFNSPYFFIALIIVAVILVLYFIIKFFKEE